MPCVWGHFCISENKSGSAFALVFALLQRNKVMKFSEGDDKMKGMGIRLVMQLADEVRYTYSINLNNLMIMLKDKQ